MLVFGGVSSLETFPKRPVFGNENTKVRKGISLDKWSNAKVQVIHPRKVLQQNLGWKQDSQKDDVIFGVRLLDFWKNTQGDGLFYELVSCLRVFWFIRL